jgi:RNA polymerase sigma-70 factor (sigma-E family)
MGLRPGSFEEFVDLHVEALLRMASVITWDDDEAEDLVQECLLRVARHWARVGVMDAPLAYARRVLVNLSLDDRRRRDRRQFELRAGDTGGDDHDPSGPDGLVDLRAEAALDALGDRSELFAAFGLLSPQQRTVLMLRYFHDQSEAQVSELLGCSVGTVKSSASRGLARLRELIATSVPSTEVCEQ